MNRCQREIGRSTTAFLRKKSGTLAQCWTNVNLGRGTDPAGAKGPVCGGLRCIGGTAAGSACRIGNQCLGGVNFGADCTNSTACPASTCGALCTPGGGICGRPGEPTKPSACLDDSINTPGVLDCSDLGGGEGECTAGPITTSCSVASGHAQRGCTVDSECGAVCTGGANNGAGCSAASACPGGTCTGLGSCEANNRLCFLTGDRICGPGLVGTGNLTANGMEDLPMNDVAHPTLGAVFCVGPTGSTSVNNVAGLPGPGRVTIRGTATGLP